MTAARTAPATTGARLRQRYAAALMPNYGTPRIALVRGDGVHVTDADGRTYLDLVAGIAVSALGHRHPALVDAVRRQVETIAHTSNLYLHPGEVALAERLLALLGADGRVLLCNSGTEATETAVKLVRKRAGADRPVLVAAADGFHGRTLGALAITGKAAIREPFGPFGPPVRFVPYGDPEALDAAVDGEVAGVFLEPVQGEAGVVPPPDGYLAAARRICDARGALLVIDEIQGGIGRAGTWFAHQHDGIVPDVLTLAKGLGGGLPIGACIGVGDCGTALAKGDHGSTFGGNPIACAAALAVLDTIAEQHLLDHAATLGTHWAAELAAIDHPLLGGVRGRGLWRALALHRPVAPAVEAAAADAGFLVNAVRPDAIRLAPPLIITAEQAASFTAALPGILDAARESA